MGVPGERGSSVLPLEIGPFAQTIVEPAVEAAAGSFSLEEMSVKELKLDEILRVGIEEIDEDHQRLVDLFNILNHSVTGGDPPAYLSAVLEELINCTAWHFSHEERLMLMYDYEEISEHKEAHQDLMGSVRELQQKVLREGNRVAEQELEFLEQWLTEHILGADMRLGSYLIEVM